MNPTHVPTFAPTFADAVPSTLVLGMGIGTFIVLVLSIAVSVVWLMSMTCELPLKIVSRFLSGALYAAAVLVLVFSPRESKYPNTIEDLTKIYDDSIIPRIAICCVTGLFAAIAGAILLVHLGEKRQLSTTQQDAAAFWLDE